MRMRQWFWSPSLTCNVWIDGMARIGHTKCGLCGCADASVSETATGTLSLSCHRCEFSGYAKSGTRSARLIRAAMVVDDDAPEPATAPAPAVKPIKTALGRPAPVPAIQSNNPFSLGAL